MWRKKRAKSGRKRKAKRSGKRKSGKPAKSSYIFHFVLYLNLT
jgi:hypothetical protein